MLDTIKYRNVTLSVNRLGAEIKSIIVDEVEYMWNKNEIWAKTSPILFPFIGILKDNKYIYDNKEYKIQKHGFAREMYFELIEKSDKKLIYLLKYQDETIKIYPFKFEFIIEYEILNNCELSMKFIVRNIDNKTMYFNVGAHPAFYIEDMENSFIQINEKKDIYSIKLDGIFVTDDKILIEKNSNKFYIKDELFEKNDTLIIPNIKESILKSKNKKVTVKSDEFLYTAYWKPKNASFICIEPWQGLPSLHNANYNLEEKKGIEKLAVGEIFTKCIVFKFEKVGEIEK